MPSSVEAIVLSSRSIKLHWTITYSPEHEIIEGFFVGYKSFNSHMDSIVHGNSAASAGTTSDNSNSNSRQTSNEQQQQQPTFTYKTIRLNNNNLLQRPQQLTILNNSAPADSNSGSDLSSAFLSPISSITKHIPAPSSTIVSSPTNAAFGVNQQQPQVQQTIVVVVSNFEYIINGLERNTEYSILIQCFNKKGAGPTSDSVIFKTLVNGKFNCSILIFYLKFNNF